MPGRVLVIDDEPGIREFMRDLFAGMGADADTATNGHEGLERLRMQPYDLVVSDYYMPGLAGLKLIDRIREISPDMPVMLLTGSELIVDSVPAEVVVLRKPVAIAELLESLGRWLEPAVSIGT
jgi:CheY-like chemotaxis protein